MKQQKCAKAAEREVNMLKNWKDFFMEDEGMGTVEIIHIIVVLISLVIIFKDQLTSLVEAIFEKITRQAKSV